MTIALATMVKNESDVIVRMLTSVRLLVDSVIMLDTGSTDDTIAKAQAWCKGYGLPFHLIEYPFDNFGDSRTRLLAFAKGKADWIFMLDADWTIELQAGQNDFSGNWDSIKTTLSESEASSHSVVHGDTVAYWQPHFLRGDQDWNYVGAAHEYLARTEQSIKLYGLRVVGHACDPAARLARTHRNLKLLLTSFAEDPKNPRTIFYLARTYRQLGLYDMARPLFQQRAKMGGWDEEVFLARCDAAYCRAPSDPLEFWEAWVSRPQRAEPLFWLSKVYHQQGQIDKAIVVNALRATISIPPDILFVDTAAYGPDVKPY